VRNLEVRNTIDSLIVTIGIYRIWETFRTAVNLTRGLTDSMILKNLQYTDSYKACKTKPKFDQNIV